MTRSGQRIRQIKQSFDSQLSRYEPGSDEYEATLLRFRTAFARIKAAVGNSPQCYGELESMWVSLRDAARQHARYGGSFVSLPKFTLPNGLSGYSMRYMLDNRNRRGSLGYDLPSAAQPAVQAAERAARPAASDDDDEGMWAGQARDPEEGFTRLREGLERRIEHTRENIDERVAARRQRILRRRDPLSQAIVRLGDRMREGLKRIRARMDARRHARQQRRQERRARRRAR